MSPSGHHIGRERDTEVVVELRIPHYGKPESDYQTAQRVLSVVRTAMHGGQTIRGRWKRSGERSTRPIELSDHGSLG